MRVDFSLLTGRFQPGVVVLEREAWLEPVQVFTGQDRLVV